MTVEEKTNILIFTRSATAILQQTYTESTLDDLDENLQAVIDIGQSLRQEIRADQKKTELNTCKCSGKSNSNKTFETDDSDRTW